MRQLPLRRIGNDPQRREWKIALRRDLCRDMQFHVNGVGAGAPMQHLLAGAARDWLINSRKIDPSGAKRLLQRNRPRGIGVEPFTVCDDRTRDEHGAQGEAWRKPSGDAKADDGAISRNRRLLQLALQARAISSPGYDVNLGSGCELCLRLEAGNGDDARQPRLRRYIPNCVVRCLPLFRLR